MFYFFHGTSLKSFKNILKTKYIYASKYIDEKNLEYVPPDKCYLHEYVFTNIYVDDLPLRKDETKGYRIITLIIDPIILKYQTCYFNDNWSSDIDDHTIIMNDNINKVLDIVKNNYSYPYIMTHEALFKKRISMKFVTGIICENILEDKVRKYLDKYGYATIKIFNKFPTLVM